MRFVRQGFPVLRRQSSRAQHTAAHEPLYLKVYQPMNPPQVKIVAPNGMITTGHGAKVFINGIEFENLHHISFTSDIGVDDVITSTISLTFYGNVLVEPA